MKRTLILIVAMLVLVAMAVPAGARPGKGKSSPLEVTNDTDHFWANAAGDVIVWSVFVANKGSEALGAVATDPVLPLILGDADSDGSLDPGETWQYEYSYTVTEAEAVQELDAITKTVTVTAGDHTASTTMSVDTKWLAECDFVGDPELGPLELAYGETNPPDAMGPCYYAFGKGYWKLTLTPTGEFGKKPLSPSMTMRDGVPGNWCKIPDGDGGFLEGSGVASTQWREKDHPPLELLVGFPETGECLQGGAGGETIGVNNPDIFFLAAWGFSEGNITATRCSLIVDEDGTITGCNP